MYCLIALSTVLALSTFSSAKCFFPNGVEASLDTACNPNAIESACCFDGQACLSNGLCVSDPHNETLARFHRGTCTDANWRSGNCPKECLDISDNGVPVYSCNSTTTDNYCCFDNCECDSRWEVFSFAGAPADVYTITIIGEAFIQTRSSASSTLSSSASRSTSAGISTTIGTSNGASTASPVSTTPPTSTPSTTPAPQQSSKSGTAAGVGIGIGVGVGGAALIGAAAFFLYRRKRNGNNAYVKQLVEAPADNHYRPPPAKPATAYAYFAGDQNGTTRGTTELPTQSYEPVELPAYPIAKNTPPVKF